MYENALKTVLNAACRKMYIKIMEHEHEVSHFYFNIFLPMAFRVIFEAFSYIVT